MRTRLGLLMLLLMTCLAIPAVLAKGLPQRVTISGGDLVQEIDITEDEETLGALAMMSLEDYETRSEQRPEALREVDDSDGYLLTRYYQNSVNKRYFPFDEVRYFPDADGGQGYLLYVGIVNGSSEYDGEWFRPSADGEATLQALIADAERPVEQVDVLDALWTTFTGLLGAR